MSRETLTVACRDGSSYPIVFGPLDYIADAMAQAGLRPGRCFVVTDLQVADEHGDHLEALLAWAGYRAQMEIIPSGESSKSAVRLDALYESALSWGIDRQTPLIALGGGVVGDLAGFAAATLLRGLPFVQIPTTLIAQVDSAIGGKTGINHRLGKNLIGAFYPPRLVYVDSGLLATLPAREWTGGLAEVVKHACIADAAFFGWLEANWSQIERRKGEAVEPLIRRAAAIKVEIVSTDEHERDTRMLLNFGHTFGHAIERVAGYGTYSHGEAVALGMRAAVHLSHVYHPDLPVERLLALIDRVRVPESSLPLSLSALMEAMQYDKKADRGNLRFVLLRALGDAYVRGDIPTEQVAEAFRAGLGRRVSG